MQETPRTQRGKGETMTDDLTIALRCLVVEARMLSDKANFILTHGNSPLAIKEYQELGDAVERRLGAINSMLGGDE